MCSTHLFQRCNQVVARLSPGATGPFLHWLLLRVSIEVFRGCASGHRDFAGCQSKGVPWNGGLGCLMLYCTRIEAVREVLEPVGRCVRLCYGCRRTSPFSLYYKPGVTHNARSLGPRCLVCCSLN